MKFIVSASCAIVALLSARGVSAQPAVSYVPGSLVESTIAGGPWTLHQAGPGGHDASGIVPPASGPSAASGTPYADICTPAGRRTNNTRVSLMQPYYFPFVMNIGDEDGRTLLGFFDYRPRNEDEQTVTAFSRDKGRSWIFNNAALGLNPYCPADQTDPDNANILVNGVATPYSTGDNGLGHPFAAFIDGKAYLYNLDRADGHIDVDQLVVHRLRTEGETNASRLPREGFVSPLSSGGYPTLEATAQATTGLIGPDDVIGNVKLGDRVHAYIYVSKQLNGDLAFPTGQRCSGTPPFALTNLINGRPRGVNDDVTTLRIATTTDGLNFTDAGAVSGINDPTTVAFNGVRYVGSGGVIPLANGHYGMFFSGGNCLDNDSDGFHFIGYAETVDPVRSASDLLNWTVVNGFDNPILSTDTVTDPSGRPYPLNAPIVDAAGANRLTAAQVAPFQPVGPGLNTNFFSGRAYNPQPIITSGRRVTVVFAGYNTPQPSNNLGDYRSVGRFALEFPGGYFASPNVGDGENVNNERDQEDGDN